MSYGQWTQEESSCPRCKDVGGVKSRVWTSYDEGHEDVQYYCDDCGHEWWVDGGDY